MLEILVLIFLCKNIGRILRQKGRSPLPFQIMTVVLWFGGEIVGASVYSVARVIAGQPIPEDGFDFTVYLFALLGAGVGTAVSFLIANMVPAKNQVAETGQPMSALGAPSNNPYNPYDPSNPFADK